jgi:hypothetical protein
MLHLSSLRRRFNEAASEQFENEIAALEEGKKFA